MVPVESKGQGSKGPGSKGPGSKGPGSKGPVATVSQGPVSHYGFFLMIFLALPDSFFKWCRLHASVRVCLFVLCVRSVAR